MSTKNLGERLKVWVRLGPETRAMLAEIAKLVPLTETSVVALSIAMLAAQFAPLLARRGLSLDVLEEEARALFADARRVVNSTPAPPRKSA